LPQPEINIRIANILTLLLVIIGGLNWGLVGLFDFDLVSALLGNSTAETATSSVASRIVYILVAVAAVIQAYSLSRQLSSNTAYETTI